MNGGQKLNTSNGIVNTTNNLSNSSNGLANQSPSLGMRPISPSNLSQLFSISQIMPSIPASSTDFMDKFSGSFDFGMPSSFPHPQFFIPQQSQQLPTQQLHQQQQQQQQNPLSQSKIQTLRQTTPGLNGLSQQQKQPLNDMIHSIPLIPISPLLGNGVMNGGFPSPLQSGMPRLHQSSSQIPISANPLIPQPPSPSSSHQQHLGQIQNSSSSSLDTLLDDANFPTLNANVNLKKSVTGVNNNSLPPTILDAKNPLSASQERIKEEKLKKKKEKLELAASNDATNKVKLSWFEFQHLSSNGQEVVSADCASNGDEQPSRILWVGNIGLDVTEEELKTEFGIYGELESVRILHDRFCAFVNFKDASYAAIAKKNMHNQVLGSQFIVVNFRHPKNDDIVCNGGPGATLITTPETLNSLSRAIYIGNVSDNLPEKEIRRECEKYGEIESVRILRKKACAFVNFMNIPNATVALQALNGKKLGDTIVRVNYGKPQPPYGSSDRNGLSSGPHDLSNSGGSGNNSTNTSPILSNSQQKIIQPSPRSLVSANSSWGGVIARSNIVQQQSLDNQNKKSNEFCELCTNGLRSNKFVRCPFCQEQVKEFLPIHSS
eukprot:gene6787-7890_t